VGVHVIPEGVDAVAFGVGRADIAIVGCAAVVVVTISRVD